MFNSNIQDIKRSDDTFNYFDVIFSNGTEEYIEEYKVCKDFSDFEINNLELTQIPTFIEVLNKLEIQYESIYNENGILNFIKNDEE